jgi:hypothetical protein
LTRASVKLGTRTIAPENDANVFVVYLRTPRMHDKDESRDDPFWEFGSFGCTGCHNRNLMNPKRANELHGAQLAFVQGGPAGVKLVHVTPQIKVRSYLRSKVASEGYAPDLRQRAYCREQGRIF